MVPVFVSYVLLPAFGFHSFIVASHYVHPRIRSSTLFELKNAAFSFKVYMCDATDVIFLYECLAHKKPHFLIIHKTA
jgi:hypothetical protein